MNLGISIKRGIDRDISKEHIDFYKQNGIRHLEISILDCSQDSVYFSKKFTDIANDLSKDFSLSYHAIMWINYIHPAKHTRREAFGVLERMLRLCDETGAMWLTIHIGNILGAKSRLGTKLNRFAAELNEMYDRCNFKTPVCIENMPVIDHGKLAGEKFCELERVLYQVDASRCGLLMDIGHYFVMADRHMADKSILTRTMGVHVHNNSGVRDTHRHVYDGVNDIKPILKDILEYAPEAKLIFEYYDFDFNVIRKSIEYINDC